MTLIFIYFPFSMFLLLGVDKGIALTPTYPQLRRGTQTYIVFLKQESYVLN